MIQKEQCFRGCIFFVLTVVCGMKMAVPKIAPLYNSMLVWNSYYLLWMYARRLSCLSQTGAEPQFLMITITFLYFRSRKNDTSTVHTFTVKIGRNSEPELRFRKTEYLYVCKKRSAANPRQKINVSCTIFAFHVRSVSGI